ncbi:hypothetical protein [Streptococcus cuniculi]|uniref:hypothetical protein n=1 Tax=Streptococcus cuniculi TaxID=1432788 RepID=UPI001D163ACC|nr:hypothetical protein [Streptococcus cuniculi]
MIENIAMQYLTGQLVVSYRTINRFRVASGMEDLIRNLFIDLNLRLKIGFICLIVQIRVSTMSIRVGLPSFQVMIISVGQVGEFPYRPCLEPSWSKPDQAYRI